MTTPPVVAADPLAALSPLMRWLLERTQPEEPALELLRPELTLEALYSCWLENEQLASAIRLIAAVLPPRESVWWAWISARHATQMAGGTAPTAAVHDALGAVEAWVVRPDDATRRAAWEAGNAAGLDSPVGMAAAAVFLSGTTVAPPDLPPVPPPPGAAVPLIGGAVLLAAATNTDATQIPPTLSAFAAQGLEIVRRLGGWDAAVQQAYAAHTRALEDYERATAPPAAPPTGRGA